ncbi:MAG TPA: hypothetical protein VKF32_06305 [Thermoanaerobaculia bacterium]|nr:hypothetical protein [Thermoanaerobaculia bacterium]
MRAVEREEEEDGVVGDEEREHPEAHARLPLFAILALAALVRIPFVLLPPLFSDDVFRHRWDGRVLAAGLDPYRHAPSDPALARLRDETFATINHRDVPTVYGPLAEGLLGLLARSPARASVVSIKALAAAFDLAAVAALVALGRAYRAGALAALLYAIHPLAVIETAGEGHLDGIATALLLLALAALFHARGRLAALLYAGAALVKITPLGAAPAMLRSLGRSSAVLAACAFLAAHAPFWRSRAEVNGLTVYAGSWEGNGALYPDVVRLLEKGRVAARAKAVYASVKDALGSPPVFERGWRFFYAGFFARVLLGAAFVCAAVAILRREADVVRATGMLLVALLLASPTLHPWYLVNVLPFALLFRWSSVAWLAGAAPLAHLVAHPGNPLFQRPDLVRGIELLPALALFLLADRRRVFGGP